MVAKIKSGKSLAGAINYNERKVKVGKALLIGAALYGKAHNSLSYNDKLFRLQDLAERNVRTKTNTVHTSLNFDVTENLSNEELMDIADSYMGKIGFGKQPYLVYQHLDAGHPHVHIVTTNIEASGNRISLHNIGRLLSEPARKQVEIEFGLVQADLKSKLGKEHDTVIQPILYGSTDLKRAMTNIINEVVRQYKFTSLPELNAILRLYHIEADRGNKKTVMFIRNGLRYWVIDHNGKRLGVPIKASSISSRPTLKKLEDRFRLGEYLRKPFKDHVKNVITGALVRSSSQNQLNDELKKHQVAILFRQNAEGRVFGVTYVDLKNKVVFNGSDLGKSYSAAAIIAAIYSNSANDSIAILKTDVAETKQAISPNLYGSSNSLLEDLLHSIDQPNPENLFERKKRKKRRRLNL